MLLIGCDYHPSVQQIAMLDTETGDYSEHRLKHRWRSREVLPRSEVTHAKDQGGPRSDRTQTVVRTIVNGTRL
jgi:hypothetical protein